MSTKTRVAGASIAAFAVVYAFGYSGLVATEYRSETASVAERFIPLPELNKADFNARMLALAHFDISTSTVIYDSAAAAVDAATLA
ncbi:MAG: hypothetical protein Q7R93_04670, partial [bacterium]|nr:hypothetical protein [bacterium]